MPPPTPPPAHTIFRAHDVGPSGPSGPSDPTRAPLTPHCLLTLLQTSIWARRDAIRQWPLQRALQCSLELAEARSQPRATLSHLTPSHAQYHATDHVACATQLSQYSSHTPQALRYCHDDAIPGFQLLHRACQGRSNAPPP
jgi:hypothetical protein